MLSDFLEGDVGVPGAKGPKGLMGFPGTKGRAGQTGGWVVGKVSLSVSASVPTVKYWEL